MGKKKDTQREPSVDIIKKFGDIVRYQDMRNAEALFYFWEFYNSLRDDHKRMFTSLVTNHARHPETWREWLASNP